MSNIDIATLGKGGQAKVERGGLRDKDGQMWSSKRRKRDGEMDGQ